MANIKVKNVAVIGAGYSGIVAAAHLLRHGQKVTIFERSSVAGGVWRFDPRCGPEPPYPNEHPPEHDDWVEAQNQPATQHEGFETAILSHAPPGPCYLGLHNNVSTSRMKSTLMPWPSGTDEFVPHTIIEKYIQVLATETGVDYHIAFNTNVLSVQKAAGATKWAIRTRTIVPTPRNGFQFLESNWEFDAVIVASGHYHLERIPNMPGLQELKRHFPQRVLHSKQYKSPESFRGKTVLLVGAGASSLDMAKGLSSIAKKLYRSSRGGKYDVPEVLWPGGFEKVGEIDRFLPGETADVDGEGSIGDIVLKDGSVLSDVDIIILGTGYITSYPFLRHLQRPKRPAEDADDSVIVTSDGCVTHNLYKDIFYIRDPSLVFIGVPYHISTFSLYDFQAAVVARVVSGEAHLPTRETMAREYEFHKQGIVPGSKSFHSLFQREDEYIDEVWRCIIGDEEAPEKFHGPKAKGGTDYWSVSRLGVASKQA